VDVIRPAAGEALELATLVREKQLIPTRFVPESLAVVGPEHPRSEPFGRHAEHQLVAERV
jgi:hypothetical protein